MVRVSLILIALLVCTPAMSAAAATQPATEPADAYVLYKNADAIFFKPWKQQKIESPSNSNDTFPAYPPFGANWLAMEKTDYQVSAAARDLVHQATAVHRANWPIFTFAEANLKKGTASVEYLNECRDIANNLKDAALYQSLYLSDQPAAIQTMQDLQHLALLLQNQPNAELVRQMVANGIYGLNMIASNTIISGVHFTNNLADRRDLPEPLAKQWMTELLDHSSAEAQFDSAMDSEYRQAKSQQATTLSEDEYRKSPTVAPMLPSVLRNIRRADAERDMAAMSVAAHLYQFQHGRWPANSGELAEVMGGKLPMDPFGDGKQSLGYALIVHGLPDGNDRPMVYDRDGSANGLFYSTIRPHYDCISCSLRGTRQDGGEFRDVARWTPLPNSNAGPTTRPLAP